VADPSELTALPVEFLCRLEFSSADPPIMLGDRVIVVASAGTFEGPRLSGTVRPPGADWATLKPDGTVRIDVRGLLHTHDGADILVEYQGVGLPVDGGLELRTTPRFHTADERYSWLTSVQAVGIGTFQDSRIAYDLYALQ